jgi:tRNA G10  N-methylase Trm11
MIPFYLEEKIPKHPARYSKQLLPILEEELKNFKFILDPMAGTGEALLSIRPDAWLVELQQKWAAASKKITFRSFVGDVHDLPWPDGFFDAIVTSPTYGNRMADHHNARDASRRNTYRHVYGENLEPNNSGMLQWGDEYCEFHEKAWNECYRVTRSGGRLILNIKNHIRNGKVIDVSQWHILTLWYAGFTLIKIHEVQTPGQRHGANHHLRVGHENIFIFKKQ